MKGLAIAAPQLVLSSTGCGRTDDGTSTDEAGTTLAPPSAGTGSTGTSTPAADSAPDGGQTREGCGGPWEPLFQSQPVGVREGASGVFVWADPFGIHVRMRNPENQATVRVDVAVNADLQSPTLAGDSDQRGELGAQATRVSYVSETTPGLAGFDLTACDADELRSEVRVADVPPAPEFIMVGGSGTALDNPFSVGRVL